MATLLVMGAGAPARADDKPAASDSTGRVDPSAPERPSDAAPSPGGDTSLGNAPTTRATDPSLAGAAPPAPSTSDGAVSAQPSAPSKASPGSTTDSPASDAPSVDVHAFVSQGFILSTGNNYLTQSKRGSFEFNEVGINFTTALGDRLRAGLQLFARDLGPVGNYTPSLDWAYLDYRFTDWLGVRAGRTKVPFGLYNEVNDVDAARVPILLPQSVYPILNRDMLLAQTGGEIYGYLRMGDAGALDYRFYGGTLFAEAPAATPPLQLKDFQVPYVVGGRILWETPLEGLRGGASLQTLRFDSTYTLPGAANMPPTIVTLGIPFVLWLASVEYAAHDLTVAAEYGRWKADVETNLGPTTSTENERYYLMAGYRLAPWFMPGAYYSHLIPNVDKRSGRENYQDDFALTLRFDVNAHWIWKAESHYMHGTTDLSPALNDGTPLKQLERDWAAFFLKTTVYF